MSKVMTKCYSNRVAYFKEGTAQKRPYYLIDKSKLLALPGNFLPGCGESSFVPNLVSIKCFAPGGVFDLMQATWMAQPSSFSSMKAQAG